MRLPLIGRMSSWDGDWAGLEPKLSGALPILPANPAWARVANLSGLPTSKLLKDETDGSLCENFEHEAQEDRCRDSDRWQHPADPVGLWNSQAPSGGAATTLPPSFNGQTSPDNSAQIGTAEFFDDPTLTSLINQGLAGNQNLKILAQNIEIANNEVLRRRGAYLPFVTFGGGASLNKYSLYTLAGSRQYANMSPDGSNFPTPLPDFLTAGNFSWQVDIWRQLRNARDAAVYRYFGTREGWNFVVTRLIADIADNYYELMALDKRMENSGQYYRASGAKPRDRQVPEGIAARAPSWVSSVSWPRFAKTRAKS